MKMRPNKRHPQLTADRHANSASTTRGVLSLALAFALLVPAAAAQTRRGQSPQRKGASAANAGAEGAGCAAWRGKITYYRNAAASGRSSVPAYGTDINTSSDTLSGEI